MEDAAQTAVKEAVKTIRNVHAIEVLDKTAKVDPKHICLLLASLFY
jgi:flavin-binding protein dodecin